MAEDFSDKNKNYGLPKVDPQPIDRKQPGIAKDVSKTEKNPENKDNRLMIVVLSVIGVLILASLCYMIFWSGDNGNKAQVEDRAVIDQENDEDDMISEETSDAEVALETADLTEEPGTITTISQRTNRYYIFLGSYKFSAYARRHAEKLAADGFAVKLIAPDNWVGMRVAVGNYAKEEEAKVDAQQIRSRYGNEVVISKY